MSVLTEPKPGKSFEYRGLTWEFVGPGRWTAALGQSRVGLSRWTLEGAHYWRSIWDPDNVRHDTWQAACDWAIRTCPAAKCETCAHFDEGGSRRAAGAFDYCMATESETPADGYCHKWSAKPCT